MGFYSITHPVIFRVVQSIVIADGVLSHHLLSSVDHRAKQDYATRKNVTCKTPQGCYFCEKAPQSPKNSALNSSACVKFCLSDYYASTASKPSSNSSSVPLAEYFPV